MRLNMVMSGLVVMILSRWVRIMRFRSMVIGMITWFMVGMRLWRSSISFTTFTINSSGMVTGSKIFIENSSIAAMKGILLSISMAIMVNFTSSLGISIMTVRIGYFTAIKICISVMRCDGHRFDLFWLIRSFFEHHGTLRFVGMRWSITVSRCMWGSIGRFGFMVSRCRG